MDIREVDELGPDEVQVESIPQIVYWMGEPIADLPREELLEIVHHLVEELEAARDRECQRGIAHVRDLAAMSKAAAGLCWHS